MNTKLIREQLKREISHTEFNNLIPISPRTFGIFKSIHGSKPLRYFYEILRLEEIPLGKKKRMFYDSYKDFHENRKDLIWESFINNNVLLINEELEELIEEEEEEYVDMLD